MDKREFDEYEDIIVVKANDEGKLVGYYKGQLVPDISIHVAQKYSTSRERLGRCDVSIEICVEEHYS